MQARFFSVFWLNGYQPSAGLKFLRRSTSGSAWLQDSGRVLGDPCREEAHVIPCSSVWLLSAASSLWASGHGDCCVFPTGIQAGTLGIIQDYHKPILIAGLPWWLSGKDSTCHSRRHGFDLWVGNIPWRRKWLPTLVLLPGKSHGQRGLAGYIQAMGHKELDTTLRLDNNNVF